MTGLAQRKRSATRVHAPLTRRVNPIRAMLSAALRDDCGFFAAVSHFAATPLHEARRFCRCVAIRAGWKMTAAASVVRSDSAISLPMLDVPGRCEKYRLPKAMAVVQALKRIARVRLDCRKFVSPERQAMM